MAIRLIKVPVGDGSDDVIEVEVDTRDLGGVELVADDGEGAARAPFTLANSLDRVMPAISQIVTRLRTAAHAPDGISMELGLTFGGETGLIFAKGTAEATFTVTMSWTKPTQAAPTQAAPTQAAPARNASAEGEPGGP